MIILVVEDNPDHAVLLRLDIGKHPSIEKLFHVPDGESGIDYLENQNNYSDTEKFVRPDLIILDSRLPRMDGKDFLEKVKATEKFQEIPVVILTTSNSERDKELFLSMGALDYKVKPMKYEEFDALVQDLT